MKKTAVLPFVLSMCLAGCSGPSGTVSDTEQPDASVSEEQTEGSEPDQDEFIPNTEPGMMSFEFFVTSMMEEETDFDFSGIEDSDKDYENYNAIIVSLYNYSDYTILNPTVNFEFADFGSYAVMDDLSPEFITFTDLESIGSRNSSSASQPVCIRPGESKELGYLMVNALYDDPDTGETEREVPAPAGIISQIMPESLSCQIIIDDELKDLDLKTPDLIPFEELPDSSTVLNGIAEGGEGLVVVPDGTPLYTTRVTDPDGRKTYLFYMYDVPETSADGYFEQVKSIYTEQKGSTGRFYSGSDSQGNEILVWWDQETGVIRGQVKTKEQ